MAGVKKIFRLRFIRLKKIKKNTYLASNGGTTTVNQITSDLTMQVCMIEQSLCYFKSNLLISEDNYDKQRLNIPPLSSFDKLF